METPRTGWDQIPQINRDLLAPLQATTWGYVILVIGLGAGVAAGAGAWVYQIETGIGQTNLHKPIFWASYIASFVYWIGVSHSGTFISGVLRLSKAEWRRPITRIAELMTFISVLIATLCVFFHLGRVWRWYYLIPYPNQRTIWPDFRSPLMWDATAVFTYATASTIFLYLPLIPDFALVRDRVSDWRKPIYSILALGWRGSQTQWRALKWAQRIITPLIVMVMVSVHSIVGWDFGMSLVPGWHTSIIAPYFVVGAVHSGLGMVVIAMYVLRRTYHLENYIRLEHFDKMGKLLVVTTLTLSLSLFRRSPDDLVRQNPRRKPCDVFHAERTICPGLVDHDHDGLCVAVMHADAPRLSSLARRRHDRRHADQYRHVCRAHADTHSSARASAASVRVEQLFSVVD